MQKKTIYGKQKKLATQGLLFYIVKKFLYGGHVSKTCIQSYGETE